MSGLVASQLKLDILLSMLDIYFDLQCGNLRDTCMSAELDPDAVFR